MAATKKQPARSTSKSRAGTRKKTVQKKTAQKDYINTYIVGFSILSVLLIIFMFIDAGGLINGAVKNALLGCLGFGAYLVPFFLAGTTGYLIKTRELRSFWIKLLLCVLATVNISALLHFIVSPTIPVLQAYETGVAGIGGGFLGACVAVALEAMLQKIASVILLLFSLVILISFITNVSIISAIISFFKGMFGGFKEEYQNIRDVDMSQKGYQASKRKKQAMNIPEEEALFFPPLEQDEAVRANAIEAAQEFAEDLQQAVPAKNNSRKKKAKPVAEIPPEPVSVPPLAEETPGDGVDDIFSDFLQEEPILEKKTPEPEPKKAEAITKEEKEAFHKELESAIEQPAIEYIYPPTDLLNTAKTVSVDQRKEMYETSKKLVSILENFGVRAKLLQVTQGPTVTRYEIQPDTGVKLSKIVGLADDLALNLAVSTVLVAPVPGKAAVGVEIPNTEVSSVYVRELLESPEFKNAKSKLTVALGKDIGGRVIVGDIGKMPHVLIAGATGSGKSVCINTIITSILYKASPEEVKLIMVDPKVVELGVYNGIPHLLIPVVTDPKKAAGALNWAVTEMMRRYELFKETGVRKLESYNKLMEAEGGEKVPQLVIIIDELADLMMVAAKEVEDYICRLAQLARAAGIHLIIATQRPSVDVITGLIKANIPSRIAFSVSSQVDSRTILDRGGAEKLLGMGDMLYHPTGARSAVRVQGAFVSDAEIENLLNFLKENGEVSHYSEDLADHIERCSTGENGVTPDEEDDGDELLPKAIELAVELGQISTAMIQRRLKVGYARAGRIIDQMESRGIISGANGSKPRQVYISQIDMNMNTDMDEE